jgi:hypothetical protein
MVADGHPIIVMLAGGPPSTACSAALGEGVDGRPAPTMTI